ncbi:glycosyltransferase [Paenibacillus sp. MABNR03]|uniref:glycosyltransferase n=1 Tax=Paenibacillus sp. MABNR03 TaxID=3142626 RepID=UPI003D265F6C
MSSQNDRVSIIIRTKARPTLLNRALLSIQSQDYSNIEVVIVEDGPAVSESIVNKYINDLHIVYLPVNQSVGRSKAANIGLEHATGKYINFLDDDDFFLPNHISTLHREIVSKPNVSVVHSASIEKKVIYHSLEPLCMEVTNGQVRYNYPVHHERIFFENMFPIQAAMFKKELYEQVGGIDESLEWLEDWDLWIKFSMISKFIFSNQVTSVYHIPGDKETNTNRSKVLKRYEKQISNKYLKYIELHNLKRPGILNKILRKFKWKVWNMFLV